MRLQDFIADQTQHAAEAILAQAKRMPADKLTWSPMDEGRSALNQLQECAFLLSLMPELVAKRALPPMTPEFRADMMTTREAWDTLEKVEAKLNEVVGPAVEAIRTFPDSDLEQTMPFFGGAPWKMVDVLNAQAWNMHYHTGQVCYIQTLLGDKSMQ